MREILQRLTGDVEMAIRISLAEKLADDPDAPLDLILLLCDDKIEVARPLILRSRKLSDDELLRLIADADVARQAACAARPYIGEPVTERACEERCRAGAGGAGAQRRPRASPSPRLKRWSRNPKSSRPCRSRWCSAAICPRRSPRACATGCRMRSRPISCGITMSRRKRSTEAATENSGAAAKKIPSERGQADRQTRRRRPIARGLSAARTQSGPARSVRNRVRQAAQSRHAQSAPRALRSGAAFGGAGLPRGGHRPLRSSPPSSIFPARAAGFIPRSPSTSGRTWTACSTSSRNPRPWPGSGRGRKSKFNSKIAPLPLREGANVLSTRKTFGGGVCPRDTPPPSTPRIARHACPLPQGEGETQYGHMF